MSAVGADAGHDAQVVASVAVSANEIGAKQRGHVGQALGLGLLGEHEISLGRLAFAGEGRLEVGQVHGVQRVGTRQPAFEVAQDRGLTVAHRVSSLGG